MSDKLKLSHVISIEKKYERKSTKVLSQVEELVKRALAGGRAERGWSCDLKVQDPDYLPGDKGVIYKYDMVMKLNPTRERTQEQVNHEFDNIVKIVVQAGNGPKWVVRAVNGKAYVPEASMNEEGQERIPYAECHIDAEWDKFYEHIYDREYQINIIITRIAAALDSDWVNRFHCALVGEPAGGKTEVARATKKMLGDHAVLELDATATTQAGVIKELSQRSELPRVIIIEEIEKADFKQLPWLLSMLDPRGEIRKLNYRNKVLFEMRGLCIATINNYRLFKTVCEGALASRFGDPIFFPRPTETILRMILERDIELVGGKKAWIDPTIEYCKEAEITDPRSAQSICLAGKDLLISGDYQKMLRATRIPKDYDK